MLSFYSKLPPSIKDALKRILKAQGHSDGLFDTLKAYRQARGPKSIENSLKELVTTLTAAEISSLEGLECLDFGSGYVLSDAVGLYLLGAKKIYSIDYFPIFKRKVLVDALKRISRKAILEIVAPLVDVRLTNDRLNKIEQLILEPNELLDGLNINYEAPIDYSVKRLSQNVDFIHSTSVFEHIPLDKIEPIINNLAKTLKLGGKMVTKIHLEDHRDIEKNPFEFYSATTSYSYESDFDARGNRLLKKEWIDYFSQVSQLETSLIGIIRRNDIVLPSNLVSAFRGLPAEEINISNIWFESIRKD